MPNTGCPQGPPLIIASTQSESVQVLAHLQSRVAVLEVELSHVRNEKNVSRVVNQYLLDSLASNLQGPNTTVPTCHPDVSDLRAQLAKSEQKTDTLQIHLTLLKDDYAKLRLKFKRSQAIRRTSRQWSRTRHQTVVAEGTLGQGTGNSSPRCPTSEDAFDLLDSDALETLEAATSKMDLLAPAYPDVTVPVKPERECVTAEDIFVAPPPQYLPHFKSVNTGRKPRSSNPRECPIEPVFERDVQLPVRPRLIPLVEENHSTLSSPRRRPFHNDLDRPHKSPVATDLDYGSTNEKSPFDDGYKVVEVLAFGAPLNFGSHRNITTIPRHSTPERLPRQDFAESLLSSSGTESTTVSSLVNVPNVASSPISKAIGRNDDRDRPCGGDPELGLDY